MAMHLLSDLWACGLDGLHHHDSFYWDSYTLWIKKIPVFSNNSFEKIHTSEQLNHLWTPHFETASYNTYVLVILCTQAYQTHVTIRCKLQIVVFPNKHLMESVIVSLHWKSCRSNTLLTFWEIRARLPSVITIKLQNQSLCCTSSSSTIWSEKTKQKQLTGQLNKHFS